MLFHAFNLGVRSSDVERINLWFMALIPLALHSFSLWFAQFQQKTAKIVLLTRFKSLFFWLWVNHFCLFCVYMMLVCHSHQLSHTWLDFSLFLRVKIWETRILWFLHFSYSCFLSWIFSWRDLFPVKGTLVVFFAVHNLWASHTLFFLLRLVCCNVDITLCRLASHLPLLVFGSIW